MVAAASDDAHVRLLLARALIGSEDPTAAMEQAQRAAAIAPDSEWSRRLASIAARQLHHRDDAIAHAEAAVELTPELAVTHITLAQALVCENGGTPARGQRGRALARARGAARHAASLAPQDPGTHFTLGLVLAAAGDRAGAETAYRRTLELDPAHSAAHNNLASLQASIGPGSRPARSPTRARWPWPPGGSPMGRPRIRATQPPGATSTTSPGRSCVASRGWSSSRPRRPRHLRLHLIRGAVDPAGAAHAARRYRRPLRRRTRSSAARPPAPSVRARAGAPGLDGVSRIGGDRNRHRMPCPGGRAYRPERGERRAGDRRVHPAEGPPQPASATAGAALRRAVARRAPASAATLSAASA